MVFIGVRWIICRGYVQRILKSCMMYVKPWDPVP